MNHRELLLLGAETKLARLDDDRIKLVAIIEELNNSNRDAEPPFLPPKDSPRPKPGSVLDKVLNDIASAPVKKLHWTQRPENRAKLARVARKGHRTRKGKHE